MDQGHSGEASDDDEDDSEGHHTQDAGAFAASALVLFLVGSISTLKGTQEHLFVRGNNVAIHGLALMGECRPLLVPTGGGSQRRRRIDKRIPSDVSTDD